MAADVGPDGRVCGIDTSGAMLDVAARRDPDPHLPRSLNRCVFLASRP